MLCVGILLQVQGRILAVKVPVINALILIKNLFLGKGERNVVVHIAKLCIFGVRAAQELFVEVRFYYFCILQCILQQRFTCCIASGGLGFNQALIGIVIMFAIVISIFIDCGVIDCHEAIFFIEVAIKPPKIQCSANGLKSKSPISVRRLKMACINRILCIAVPVIIT